MTIEEILAKSNPIQPQIETSKSEYKKLVDTNTKLIDKMKDQEEEIERLNNIINELEKWLNEEYDATIFDYHNAIEDVINKLIELRGSE